MNINKYEILVAIIVVLFGIWVIGNKFDTNIDSQVKKETIWIDYVNNAYKYKVKYPEGARVYSPSETAEPLDRIMNLQISVEDINTRFFVDYFWLASDPRIGISDEVKNENEKLFNSTVKEFAEALHQYQIDDDNSNIKNRKVGDLKEIQFADKTAYSFTLDKGFREYSSADYGYAIPDGMTYNYIFVENNFGDKLIIYYRVGDDLSEQIKDSFGFL